jgi:hypothetical protein
VPDDWGAAAPGAARAHHGSTWAGLAGAGVGGNSSQNGSQPEGSGEEAWPNADVSAELETEEAPDIVKLRPQEVVCLASNPHFSFVKSVADYELFVACMHAYF